MGALRFMGVTASLRWKQKVKVNQLSRQATRDKKKVHNFDKMTHSSSLNAFII